MEAEALNEMKIHETRVLFNCCIKPATLMTEVQSFAAV